MSDEHLTVEQNRLASIENNHLLLQKDVSDLAKDTSALAQAVRGISDSIGRIAETQNNALRTNWSVVFAGLGVVVLVVGLVIYDPLSVLIKDHRNHIRDGHPKSVLDIIRASVTEMELRVKHMDQSLHVQAEMLDTARLKLEAFESGTTERILDIEREIYTGASYRSGRPTKHGASGEARFISGSEP